jgi:hypothetical protein
LWTRTANPCGPEGNDDFEKSSILASLRILLLRIPTYNVDFIYCMFINAPSSSQIFVLGVF